MTYDNTQVQSTLGFRYGSIREIGAGGMGCVFGAYDAVLKRAVAVKLVFDWHDKGELALRFHQEAKLASRLSHPNIVKVLDFGIGENGIIYLIMDLVEGTTLYQILKDSGPMPVEAAIPMFVQICDALAHASGQGIIHRDLKPKNIMIVDNEAAHINVRIVDFGIAKVESTDQKITRTGHIVGTPLYSSPEQIQSKPVDPRSDIYSFGCVMLEVLTGSPPFRGATQFESYDMHLKMPAPRLLERGFEHEHAAELDRIIAMTLEKDRNDRYQSFYQLKADLVSLLSEESRAAVHEAAEKYTKTKYASKNFFSQYKYALAICAVMVAWGGSILFDRVQRQKPATAPSKFIEQGITPTEEEWKFFATDRNGLKTWTNIDCRMSDKHFKQLQGQDVRAVMLYAMRLNGSGLKYLKKEPLEILCVAESKIVDENLHYIGDFKLLKNLNLSYTWITDAGVESISTLPRLKTLALAGCTKLTSKSIEHVCSFAPAVVDLDLSYIPLCVPGYDKLLRLKNLERLDISLCELTDQSIEPIFKLKNLKTLTISKNKQLTDVTLNSLSNMKELEQLKIDSCCGFTPKGIAALKKALPSCRFVTETKKVQAPDFLQ